MKYFIILILILLVSCERFLDEKPDAKLTTPTTYSDLLAILDHSWVIYSQPALLEVVADNYYLTDDNWAGITNEQYRNAYIWLKEPTHDNFWNTTYRTIFYCNTVLDYADRVRNDKKDMTIDQIKGIAYFHRAYSLFNLVQVFSPYYGSDADGDKLGLVLKLNSDINETLQRSNLRDTYRQIFQDMHTATLLLSEQLEDYPTRPNRAAALGMMSRMYLAIGRYEEALAYADSCLAYRSDILDYGTIVSGQPYPFAPYNKEVIIHSAMPSVSIMVDNRAMVDSNLYRSYTENDWRKKLYFTTNNDGTKAFTGNYHTFNANVFNGLTVGEVLLTKAEAACRLGKMDIAKPTIHVLLRNRYEEVPVVDSLSKEELMAFVMEERRKELLFRGIRWMDLRRLAYAGEHVEIIRKLRGETYRMNRSEIVDFAYWIPQVAIERGNLQQNN